ncbi:G-patch domain [Macleaya cordata]|uniref:G-patch domain n=1 Tax=Macleaya cordata TaxID=56857 RepID=A0A200QJY4_MACCD|nr:G-patch domain [Macleaya cordata]
MGEVLGSSGSTTAITSSNIGFQLLKKCGWKEGAGLGVSEQGRLEPLEAHVKYDKYGLGAEKVNKKTLQLPDDHASGGKSYTAENSFEERPVRMGEGLGSWSSNAINSSNIGFQLLKKSGWKEGTGLGVAEQGRLEPLQAHVKNNKSGLGADKVTKKMLPFPKDPASGGKSDTEHLQPPLKKTKKSSRRLIKQLEQEKRLQEKEFEMAFFREFWPDNV